MKNKKHIKGPSVPAVDCVDLFCGAGGLTYGLAKSGINVRCGIDIDPACEFPYSHNNNSEFLLASVEDISAKTLSSYFRKGNYSLLAGCAPCQTFSSYNQKASTLDDRWWLLDQFSRIVRGAKPDIVTMENVPLLTKYDVYTEFRNDLEELAPRYFIWKVAECYKLSA